MTNLLITGGAGFIGEHLTRCLVAEGHFVRVVDLPEREKRLADLPRDSLHYRAGSFAELAETDSIFEGVESIIHLASTSVPQTSMLDIEADVRNNVLSSIRIMRAGVLAGARDFLFASSGGAVYGANQGLPVTEDDPTDPVSSYAVCKLAIEKYMAVFARTTALRAIALRISNAYGPGQLAGARIGLVANCLRKMKAGQPVDVYGDGSNTRDYLYVDDIASAFRACLARPDLKSGVYNVGSGEGHTINQVLDLIGRVSGKKPPARYHPARNFDVPHIVLDVGKFRQATGWRAEVGLEAGIGLMWQAVRARQLALSANG